MTKRWSRREVLQVGTQAIAGFSLLPFFRPKPGSSRRDQGEVAGEAEGAMVGRGVMSSGGNAIDAAVAAALTACVSSPSQCGIGGYGGSMIIYTAKRSKVTCIDFNTTAPAAAHSKMFIDSQGEVKGNFHGWLSAGVPGVLAGLQLALDRYGRKSFRELVQPAIARARQAPPNRWFEGSKLAAMLVTLGERNSVDSFYRGDIAQVIADAFQKNGGLVTAKDLAGYHARECNAYQLSIEKATIATAPLTAGGLTVLEALSILKALHWDKMKDNAQAAHARLEALRLAWRDRLTLLGDPDFVSVPVARLLSTNYAEECAEAVSRAVKDRHPIPMQVKPIERDGTVNLSSVDPEGNFGAVTLTHGGSYGAQVTVKELGLVLGHGMSRFDPRPGRANSVAPGKRPLHNMCPSLLLRDNRAVLAIGGAGGTRIPNALFDFWTALLLQRQTVEGSFKTPRLNCYGETKVYVDKNWPKAYSDYFRAIGYEIASLPGAHLSVVK